MPGKCLAMLDALFCTGRFCSKSLSSAVHHEQSLIRDIVQELPHLTQVQLTTAQEAIDRIYDIQQGMARALTGTSHMRRTSNPSYCRCRSSQARRAQGQLDHDPCRAQGMG